MFNLVARWRSRGLATLNLMHLHEDGAQPTRFCSLAAYAGTGTAFSGMARRFRWLVLACGLMGGNFLLAGTASAQTDVLVNHNGLYGGVDAAFGPAGGTFTYQARVRHNSGPTATGVQLMQSLPVGSVFKGYSSNPAGITCAPVPAPGTVLTLANNTLTCNVGTLASADGFKWVNFDVVLPDVGTNWEATASATHAGTDPDAGNNTNLPRNFTTNAAADLGVELVAPATVANGGAFNYTINMANLGPSSIPVGGRVDVTFQIPNGAVITGVPTGAGWTCTPGTGYPRISGTLVCSRLGAVVAGALPAITVPAAANQSGSIAGSVAIAGFQTSGTGTTDRMPDGQSANNEDNAVISVTGGDFVDVSLQKTVSPTTVDAAANTNVTYTLTPRREGGSIQPYGMVLTDVLPAGVSFVAFSAGNSPTWSCSHNAGTISCTHSSTVGAPYTGVNFAPMPAVSFTATVSAGATGSVINVGTIELPPALGEINTSNNSDDVSVTRSNTAQLQIRKTAPTRPVQAGQNFTFNLAVHNNGPMNILAGQAITVTETPGAGLTIVGMTVVDMANWSCSSATVCDYTGGLANGATLNVTVTANVATAAGTHATFSNTAGAGVTGRDNTPVSNGTTVVVSNETADVGIVKTITSPAGPIASGDTVAYNLRVTNNGTTPVTGITVTDELIGLVRQDEGGTVDTPTVGSPRYPGGGFVSATPGSGAVCSAPTGGVNSESRTLTCTIATLAAGVFVDIPMVIRPKVGASGTYNNTATARSSDINDNNGSNDSSTVGIAATALVDLVALKQVSPLTAAAGAPLTFLATVRNDGPSSAQAVTMVDTLPTNAVLIGNPTVSDSGSCTLGGGATANPRTAGGTLNCSWPAAVSSRGQRTVTFQMRSLGDLPANTVVHNEITVATTTPELRSDNNSASADATITRAELDVTLGMSHTNDGLLAGEGTRYTITVTNAGPSYVTNVVMVDSFPTNLSPSVPSTATFSYQGGLAIGGAASSVTGTVACTQPAVGATSGPLQCSIPVLPPGSSVTISFDMNAQSLPDGASTGTVYHRATVTPSETEWLSNGNDVIVNNTTTDRTSMSLTANNVDLGITKQGPDGSVDAGDTVVYTLTVTNYGRAAQSPAGATVTDVLPAGLDFVSASAGCIHNAGTRTVTCSVPQLAQSADAVFTLTTQLAKPYTGAHPLVNEATVTVAGDGNPGNNTSRKTTKLRPAPNDVASIPALSEWGLILMSVLLGLMAWRQSVLARRP